MYMVKKVPPRPSIVEGMCMRDGSEGDLLEERLRTWGSKGPIGSNLRSPRRKEGRENGVVDANMN